MNTSRFEERKRHLYHPLHRFLEQFVDRLFGTNAVEPCMLNVRIDSLIL